MAETHQADLAGQLGAVEGQRRRQGGRGGAPRPGSGDPTALVA